MAEENIAAPAATSEPAADKVEISKAKWAELIAGVNGLIRQHNESVTRKNHGS